MSNSNILEKKPTVINMGLELFYKSLKEQNVEVIHIDWRPPASGDLNLLNLLKKLN